MTVIHEMNGHALNALLREIELQQCIAALFFSLARIFLREELKGSFC